LTETPEVRVKVNCISSCCASDVRRRRNSDNDDDEDNTDGVDVERKPTCREKSKKSCCGKKRWFSKSHAKTEQREKEKDE
jgi:hypothetical protein